MACGFAYHARTLMLFCVIPSVFPNGFWCVYLAKSGFDFRKKNPAGFGSIRAPTLPSVHYTMKEG